MKLCPKCGRPYPDEALFCMMDGTPLGEQEAAVEATPEEAKPEPAPKPTPAPAPEPVAAAAPEPAPAAQPEPVAAPAVEAEPEPAPKPKKKKAPRPVADKESRRAKAAESLTNSFSRMRNPWSAPLYDQAPDTLTSALVDRGARSAERNPSGKDDKAFSETLWFLEGEDPNKLQELEAQGAAKRDDGHYIKRGALPRDIRDRLSLQK